MESSAFPEGCVALVTGGSRGIGLAAAEHLARAGVKVVLMSRRGTVCEREAARLSAEHGVQCAGIACDVRVPNEIVGAIRQVNTSFRRLDVLINNAGILADARLGMASTDLIRDAFETNSMGAAHVLQAASRLLLRSPAGAVVNVTSIVGADGNIGQTIYAASKAALIGLTRAAARELGPGGVRVNAVAPGLIETDMTAALRPEARRTLEERILLRRTGVPQDVAAVITFLASNESRYVTGQVLRVDGGLAI